MNRSLSPLLAFGQIGLALCLASCGTAVAPAAPTVLRVGGSTAMLPLLADLGAAYGESHPHVHLEIEGGGSRLGLERLETGAVDLAACSWLPPTGETTPSSLVITPIARDGIAILVHTTNPVDELTLLQLRSVYAGWTLEWQGVGGSEYEVLVTSREDGSGTRTAFEQQVMDEQPVTLTAVVLPSSTAVVEYVEGHSAAVGYVSMSAANVSSAGVEESATSVPAGSVKVLRIEGAYPTPHTVQNGVYHLTHPLHLVARDEPEREVQSFIDFVRSPAGQAIVGQRYGRVW